MNAEHVTIEAEKQYTRLFSICTIVNNFEEYGAMKQSFIDKGFANNCEYLVADNSDKNNFDAYSAIRRFLQDAGGQYVILVHQDVRCIDSAGKLLSSLNLLEEKDPLWAVCGNAGGQGYKNFVINMDDNGKLKKSTGLPKQVSSLDENLIIIKSDSHLSISSDINSFHLYGTDICIIADFLGYHCYVIDFMVKHLSSGNLTQLEEFVPTFVNIYGRKLRERFVQTTCTKFYLGSSESKNKLYNKPSVFFWIKAFTRLKNKFKK